MREIGRKKLAVEMRLSDCWRGKTMQGPVLAGRKSLAKECMEDTCSHTWKKKKENRNMDTDMWA